MERIELQGIGKMKYKTTIYGINPKDLPQGYYDGLQMCLLGAKEQLNKLIMENEGIRDWSSEKADKIKYLNKSIDFFIAKLEELQ